MKDNCRINLVIVGGLLALAILSLAAQVTIYMVSGRSVPDLLLTVNSVVSGLIGFLAKDIVSHNETGNVEVNVKKEVDSNVRRDEDTVQAGPVVYPAEPGNPSSGDYSPALDGGSGEGQHG